MSKKKSPFKWLPIAAAAVGIGTSIFGAVSANRARKDAIELEKKRREEMDALKEVYANMDTSNPFANLQNQFVGMQNTMEDLTVNQQQAQFEKDQFQQTQANIMGNLRGAAGGSGIAALAQQLAQSGQIAAQRSSASIGAQEAANQKLKAQEASRLQEMRARGQSNLDQLKAQGERQTQQMEMGKQATMLGMSQQEVAAAMQQQQAASSAMWGAIGGIGSGLMNLGASSISGTSAGGGGGGGTPDPSDRRLKKNIKLIGNSPSGLRIYAFEYIDKVFGSGVYQGVMSDEIPQYAVVKHKDGYDRVDYSRLDVEFKEII